MNNYFNLHCPEFLKMLVGRTLIFIGTKENLKIKVNYTTGEIKFIDAPYLNDLAYGITSSIESIEVSQEVKVTLLG